MANTNNPFSGGGGYGSVIPDEYQQVSSNVGDAYIARENKRLDSLQSALNSVIGMGARAGGADAGMAASLLPSDLNSYYQQASEAQGKAKAYEGLVKTSPELFGLTTTQAESFTDFARKLPPIAVPEFYQMALKGGMAQQELGAKMMAGKKAPLNLEGLDQGFMQAVQGSSAQPPAATSAQAMPEQGAKETPSSGTSPKPVSPTIAEMDEFDKLHPNLQPGATYVDTLSKWIRQKRGLQ